MVDLVNNHIELVSISKRIHLKLITPNSILFHVLAILVNCLIILDKRDEIVLVQPDIRLLHADNSYGDSHRPRTNLQSI